MTLLRLALRLFFSSALLLLAGVAISVMTRDAWLIVAHTAGVLSAVVASLAVLLLLLAAALRRLAPAPRQALLDVEAQPHERGLTGLE